MHIQYLGARSSCDPKDEGFLTQALGLVQIPYISGSEFGIVGIGCTQVTKTSNEGQGQRNGASLPITRDRRYRCRRASRAYSPSHWLRLPQHVHSKPHKKNSSLLSQSPSRWSQPTPANTSNTLAGQDVTPAPQNFPTVCAQGGKP